jgi:hypothetical protein
MSMEQAILELAASFKDMAMAQRDATAAQVEMNSIQRAFVGGMNIGDLAAAAPDRIKQYAEAVSTGITTRKEALADTVEIAKEKITKQRAERDADQQAAGVCPEAAEEVKGTTAKEAAENQAKLEAERAAELEAAVSKVEEESKALDYKADVRPVLLALAKKAGQPALKDLLTKYGAATGDKLTADQFAGIVADANALIVG